MEEKQTPASRRVIHLVRRELGDAGDGPLVAPHLFSTRRHRVSLLFVSRVAHIVKRSGAAFNILSVSEFL
jgi:hypothetical protein